MYYLKGNVITNGLLFENKYIEITKDKITFVGNEARNKEVPIFDIDDGFITPGFIDIHIHGVNGVDFMDDHPDSFSSIARNLPKYGVTSFLATSRTAGIEEIDRFLARAKELMKFSANTQNKNKIGFAKILGVHLEGPWISPKYKGAQPLNKIKQLTSKDLDSILLPNAQIIKRLTLAPEELNDSNIINELIKLGIQPSAGHTNANFFQIKEAIDAGLRQLTHTFNAMRPLHHREPGTVGAALYFPELFCEIISDGVHVRQEMIELLYRLKGKEKIILVSDCTGYNQLSEGKYKLRGKHLVRKGNKVMLDNGKLAGSAITLNEGVKFAVEHCGIPIEDAIYMVTEAPLHAIKSSMKIGEIKAGFKADLVILNKDLSIRQTILAGRKI